MTKRKRDQIKYTPISKKLKKLKVISSKKVLSELESESDEPGNNNTNVKMLPIMGIYDDDEVYADGNHLYFRGDVTHSSINDLLKLINEKNQEYEMLSKNKLVNTITPNALFLHITSYGGLLMNGFMGIDSIANSKIPIHTIVEGYAASAASLMSIVGKKRYMTKHSYMLIHQLSDGSHGKYEVIKDAFENDTKFMEQIKNLYLEYTKIDRTKLDDILKHDHWMTFEECLRCGLVDELYTGDVVSH